jgi:hypothetical protein
MAFINYPPNTYVHISYKTAGATYRLYLLCDPRFATGEMTCRLRAQISATIVMTGKLK